jgi:putative ABC transport system ATP-binding protein
MSQKTLEKYRRNDLGFVFQSYNLTPDLTALENVEMTAELTADPLNTAELMEKLGLGDHLHHFPKELSGGQQQRVAIARAMVKKPKLLLCDELTGALDSKSSKEVLQLIEQVNRDYGTTIVIITHNELIAGMADRVLRIKDGKVVSDTVNNAKIKAEEMEL